MTRSRTYVLTAISALLFILLCWVFADGLFNKNWWDSADYTNSAIFTYVLLALIIAAGLYQAQQLPEEGVSTKFGAVDEAFGQVEDPRFWRLFTGNVYWSILWLPLRFFIGREWLAAGEEKLRSSAWMSGGTALKGYWTSATAVPATGSPKITYGWYSSLLSFMLRHEWYTWFAKVIAIGEFLVGVGLLLGALVAIAAFFGTVMNFAYLLAGSSSSNPVLFGLSVFIILGWKVAGYWGLDRYLLPLLGVPWKAGRIFRGEGLRHHEPHEASPA
jgi:thiosulfate dehydrogenase (quinone) large subunit